MLFGASRNGQKLCFRSTDRAGNAGFGASAVVDPAPVVVSRTGTVQNSFSSTDNHHPPPSTTWHYVWIAETSVCDASAGFGSSTSYTEGADVPFSRARVGVVAWGGTHPPCRTVVPAGVP